MWRPSPMSIYRLPDDIHSIATDPHWDGDQVTWTELHPETASHVEAVNPYLDSWHGIREAVSTLDRKLREQLIRRGRVADQDRWRLHVDAGPNGIYVTARVRTWPAIPGLTTEDQP